MPQVCAETCRMLHAQGQRLAHASPTIFCLTAAHYIGQANRRHQQMQSLSQRASDDVFLASPTHCASSRPVFYCLCAKCCPAPKYQSRAEQVELVDFYPEGETMNVVMECVAPATPSPLTIRSAQHAHHFFCFRYMELGDLSRAIDGQISKCAHFPNEQVADALPRLCALESPAFLRSL
jgi:hypothetical protein